jgi:putative toxin-antitoxin system antitoxin component (TIGR02293 family)
MPVLSVRTSAKPAGTERALEVLHQSVLGRGTVQLRTRELRKLAARVFGSPVVAEDWLTTKQSPLGDRRPLECVDSPEDAEEVRQFLMRIAHGVFS